MTNATAAEDGGAPGPDRVMWSDLVEPAGLPTERLEAELVSHAAWEATGLARMLDVLAEYDRRDGWSRWIGCLGLQQWLSWQCGLGATAARERLRVARALPTLPAIRRLFHDGALSWSKVRELTRVATPRDDAVWADLATRTTAAQLARLAAAQRRITAEDVVTQEQRTELTVRTDIDGSTVIVLRLPADEAAPVLAAIDAAAGPPERGSPATRRRAHAAVALLLQRTSVRTEVQIHLDECPTCHHRRATTNDGAPVHPAVGDALACTADIVTTHRDDDPTAGHAAPDRTASGRRATDRHEVGEIDRRRGPSRRQRRWLARHHRTCQFPGCDRAGHLDAHHLVAHPDGGPTRVHNLAVLCRHHHRIVHLARLVLTLDTHRNLVVTTPAGHRVDSQIVRRALRIPDPDDPDRIRGLGERMDLDACLFAIHTAGPRPHPPGTPPGTPPDTPPGTAA